MKATSYQMQILSNVSRLASGLGPTFLHCGVQLRDFDSEPVDAVLQRVGTKVEVVGLIEQLPEYVLCMFTWEGVAKRTTTKQ